MSLDYKIIGNRLQETRISKGLTQEKLAEQLDVSTAFLSRVERGSTKISLNRLSEICSILDIQEGYILNGSSNSSKNYLADDFNSLLKQCPSDKLKLIYNIAQVIVNNEGLIK